MESVLVKGEQSMDDVRTASQCSVDSGTSQMSSADNSIGSLKSVSQCAAIDPSEAVLPDWDEEYATQFFGFTAKSFCNGMYNAMDSFVEDNLQLLTDFLRQQFPDDLSEESIKAMQDGLRAQFVSKMDKSFDKLESYLATSLMHVPEHVLLPEDAPHALSDPTEDEEGAADEEIKQLTDRIWRLKYANSVLREEVSVVEEAQSRSDAISSRLAVVDQLLKDAKVSDLRESIRFTLSRAHRCLDLVNKVQDLAAEAESPSQLNQVSTLKSEVDTILKLDNNV